MKLIATIIWVVCIILWIVGSFQNYSNIGNGIAQILLIICLILDIDEIEEKL